MLTGFKDVDLKIMSELDDRELLIICLQESEAPYINKICSFENFWKQRAEKKYGHIKKRRDRSYKNWYLKIVYYEDKYTTYRALEELALGGYKNIDLIEFFMNKKDIQQWPDDSVVKIMESAGKSGDIKLVDYFVSHKFPIYLALRGGVETGNKSFVYYILSRTYPNSNLYDMIFYSAKSGDRELLDFFIEKEEKRIRDETFLYKAYSMTTPSILSSNDAVLSGAAEGGHLDLVKEYINRIFSNRKNALLHAVKGGNEDVVNYISKKIIDKKIYRDPEFIANAARSGNIKIVEFSISKGAYDWNSGMKGAAESGHENLINFFIEKGANDWKGGLDYAIKGGYNHIIFFFKRKLDMNN